MKFLTGQLLMYFTFFLYVSNMQFRMFPDKIRTRLIIGVIGFAYYFVHFKGRDAYNVKYLIKLIFPLAIWMMLSILINLSDQVWFLQYVILQVLYAFGAIFVIHIGKIDSFCKLLWMFFLYVIIQDSIAFIGFFIPSLSLLINTIQVPELSADRIDELSTLRAFGLGEFGLFGGGAWVAIGMLVMTILYRMNKLNGYLYASFLIVLLITGLFVARTSLTGLIALSLLLIPIKKKLEKGSLLGSGRVCVSPPFTNNRRKNRG